MKLLDERGLTTVWAAIKNTFTSKSDADEKYAKKSEGVKAIRLEKTQTGDDGAMSQLIHVIKANDGQNFLSIYNANNRMDGFMSKEDKVKLDGIQSGANNYTLPVATASTLGGIKTSVASGSGTSWPVCSYSNGTAFTWIPGLNNDGKNIVTSVTLNAQNCITNYNPEDVSILRLEQSKSTTLLYPTKSGTFALTSDIPDVSSLCSFNFIDSISKCKSGRINFLFKNSNDYVDLSFLKNLEEGTILLIYSPHVGFQITNKGGVWYYNGKATAADDTTYINHAILVLAFFYNTYVYVSTFSYN